MDSVKENRVLFTGAGAPGAYGILQCIKSAGFEYVHSCDADSMAYGKHFTDTFSEIPIAESSEFITAILELTERFNIGHIIPLVTRELFGFSEAKSKGVFSDCNVWVSENEALNIANNKGRLLEYLKRKNILVPEYCIVQTSDALLEAIPSLGFPEQLVCFKPCNSNGSRGFRVVHKQVNETEELFYKKTDSVNISFERLKFVLEHQEIPETVVMEYLPGPEYSVDCLVWQGRCLVAIPRRRDKIRSGISMAGEIHYHPEIIEYCTSISESLGLEGIVGIQVKQGQDGRFKILEINPRVQGTLVATLGANINLIYLLKQLYRGVNPETLDYSVNWGVKFVRVWNEFFY